MLLKMMMVMTITRIDGPATAMGRQASTPARRHAGTQERRHTGTRRHGTQARKHASKQAGKHGDAGKARRHASTGQNSAAKKLSRVLCCKKGPNRSLVG